MAVRNRSSVPVDVIFLSDATGNIRPLRIRAQAGDEEAVVANVTEILRQKECKVYGAESQTFLCRVRSRGRSNVLELKYYVRDHRWVLTGGSAARQ